MSLIQSNRPEGTKYFDFVVSEAPNEERIDDIVRMARETNADGVFHYSLSFCQTCAAEAMKVEQALSKEHMPLLTLESDFSMNDSAELMTRVHAFVEMLLG